MAGRFDLKTDRATGTLHVLRAYHEARDGVAGPAAAELGALARLVGADHITVGRKGNLAKALHGAVRELGLGAKSPPPPRFTRDETGPFHETTVPFAQQSRRSGTTARLPIKLVRLVAEPPKMARKPAPFGNNTQRCPRCGTAALRSFALCFASVLLIAAMLAPAARAAQTSFRAQDGEIDVSDSDIAAGNFRARRDTISGWRNWANATSTQLRALTASDNSRYLGWDPGSGDNSAMIFEYTFDDDEAQLSQIDVEIELSQAYPEDANYVYLWDYDAGRYDVLGRQAGSSDQLLTFALTSNPGRYLSSSGQLTLFVVNQDSYGFQAYVLVDFLSVRLTASGPHFAFSGGGSASTCDRAEVSLEKHDASEAIETGYTGTVELSTSTGQGTWSLVNGNGRLTDLGGGDATYTYAAADAGRVDLALAHGAAGTVNLDATDGTDSESSAEDGVLVFTDPGSNSVRDEFNSFSYAGNDGSQNWTTSWLEVGESNGISANSTTVTSSSRCASGRCLRIGTGFSSRETFSNRGARREVDLSGADSARLSFSYMRGYSSGSGTTSIQVSDNGGASFTTLGTIALNGNTTSSIARSFDISAYMSANTQIRFLVSVSNATVSIYVDNVQVSYESACPQGGSFVIGHDGTGVHCLDEAFSVSARDSNDNPLPTYTETVTLSTQTGVGTFASSASNAGSFSDGTANDGVATYTFAPADGGQANFSLNYAGGAGAGAATTIDLDAFESGNDLIRDDDSEGLLSFAPSAFLLTAGALTNPLPNPVSDPIGSQIAGTNFAVHLTAFGTTAANPVCGVIESYTGAKSIGFWTSYLNPLSGSRSMSVNGAAVATSAGAAMPRSISFTNGRAVLTAAYKDVGLIQLFANDATVTEPVGGLLGSSDSILSLPADLAIVNPERADGSANPGTQVPTGDVFVAAGAPFRVTVQVVDADGDLTPNFGREISPEGLRLTSAALVAPAGGRNGVLNDGAIGNATGFSADATAGQFTGTAFSFSEVGAIQLQASIGDGDYLGGGDRPGSLSAVVGRFTPSALELTPNTPRWATACALGAFTWLDQPFSFASGSEPTLAVRAVNAGGDTTENYAGSWWRITDASLSNRLYSAGSATVDASGLPPTTTDPAIRIDGAGLGQLTFSSGTGLILERGTPEAPFDAEIALSIDVADLDGVAYASNPFRFGGTTAGAGMAFDVSKRFQFGRLRLENGHGSELVDLPLRLVTQRFDGRVFADDDSDSCSDLSAGHITLSPTPAALSSSASIAHQPLLSGQAGLVLSAPGQVGSATLSVDLGPSGANLPWLRFDWPSDGNLDGSYDDDPSGNATFGIWEGRSKLIDRREIY